MKSSDVAILAGLVLSFALLVTAHLAIVVGLFGRAPRSRGAAALIVVPLAPYWALRGGMYARGIVWIVSAVGYAAARLAAVYVA